MLQLAPEVSERRTSILVRLFVESGFEKYSVSVSPLPVLINPAEQIGSISSASYHGSLHVSARHGKRERVA